MNQNMKNAKGCCDEGVHDLCAQFVGKSMEDNGKVYVCPMFIEPDRQPKPAVDEPEWGGSIRLGTMRVMQQIVEQNPPETRSYANTGVAQGVLRPDPFLHRDVGEENANGGPAGGARAPIQGYRMTEPDVDAREDENWLGRGESGMAPSAGYQFPDAGKVGGVQKIAKRARGFWGSLILGGR